jgi:hypothetical protein
VAASSRPQRFAHAAARTTACPRAACGSFGGLRGGAGLCGSASVVPQRCCVPADARKRASQAPREVVWLNGAPGSGKGTNTPFIQRSRNLGRAVCISDLLAKEQHAAINAGALVSDAAVVDALLAALLDPARGAESAGAVIDGCACACVRPARDAACGADARARAAASRARRCRWTSCVCCTTS